MPDTNWKILSPLQMGRYAEYYAKMEFASYGCKVFTSEVDDHGVDFIVKGKNNLFYEIQVKSVRKTDYVFVKKTKFDFKNKSLYLALLLFKEDNLPDVYLIPSEAWKDPNQMFVDRPYNKTGQTSQPEWGINLSKKNHPILEIFKLEEIIQDFL